MIRNKKTLDRIIAEHMVDDQETYSDGEELHYVLSTKNEYKVLPVRKLSKVEIKDLEDKMKREGKL